MEETAVKRVMPHSTEAEQSVIGAMILDNESIPLVDTILVPEDFYQLQYGIIYGAMTELYNEGRPVDLLTLKNKLQEKNVPPEVSNMTYIGELIAGVPITANAKYYAEIVKEKSTLRRLIRASEEVAADCYGGKEPLEKILETTETKIFDVLTQRRDTEFVPVRTLALDALARIQEAAKNKNPITGIPTGFIDLDNKTSGLQPADLILIAARPSMGKTALALNIAEYTAFKKDLCTAVFSLEMSKEQLINRLFAMEAKIDSQSLRTGNLTDDDWEKLSETVDTVGRSKLIIDDTPGISVNELRTKCRKYKLEYGLQLVVIDYLQLMSGSGRRNDNRQQEISEISRALKSLARELNIPIIALSQLNRGVEQREDHRPMLSDLRESGAIEQDADIVLFLYREDYYNKDAEPNNIAEVIIAKQRNGPVGTIELGWQPNYTKFVNLKYEKRN